MDTTTNIATTSSTNNITDVDDGLSYEVAKKLILVAEKKLVILDSVKLQSPSLETIKVKQWSKADLAKFEKFLKGKTASDLIKFGFVKYKQGDAMIGSVGMKSIAGELLITESFEFVNAKKYQVLSSKILSYISTDFTENSYNNSKMTEMNLKMTHKIFSILQAGIDSTGRVDNAKSNDADFFLLVNIFTSEIMKIQVGTMFAYKDGRQAIDGNGSKKDIVMRNIYSHYTNVQASDSFNHISCSSNLDPEKVLQRDYFKTIDVKESLRKMSLEDVKSWFKCQRKQYTKDYDRVHNVSGQHDTSNPWKFFGGGNFGKPFDYKNYYFYIKIAGDDMLHNVFYGSIPATHLDLSSKTRSSKKRKSSSDDDTMKNMMESQKLARDSIKKIADQFELNSKMSQLKELEAKIDTLEENEFKYLERKEEREDTLNSKGKTKDEIGADRIVIMCNDRLNNIKKQLETITKERDVMKLQYNSNESK